MRLLACVILLTAGLSSAWAEAPAPQQQMTAQEAQVFADHLSWNAETGEVSAVGNVKIVSQERSLTGDSLSLNLKTQTGEMTPAVAQFRSIHLTAKRIEILPDRLYAYEAKITTCDEERPHYQIVTKKVDVLLQRGPGQVSAQRLKVHGAGLEFHGRRFFSLPPFSISTGGGGDGGQSLPLPYPGYGRLDGPFIGYRWNTGGPEERIGLRLDWRITAKRGMRGVSSVRYAVGKSDTIQLALSRREDPRESLGPRDIDTSLAKVLVSREPEVSLLVGPKTVTKGLRWEAQGAVGQFRELPTGVSARRATATGRLLLGPFPAGHVLRISAGAAYRLASYSDQREARVRYNRVTLAAILGKGTDISLSLVNRRGSGSTPFLFDRLGLKRELATELGFPLGSRWWRLRLLDRYDLSEGRSRDMGATLTYRAHCLDYTVGWKRSRGLFEIGVTLAAPGEPLPSS